MLRIEKRGLSDLVYEKLRGMIDEGTLAAGSKVNKPEIAERLGVSQTPINDALSRLAGEKLIEQRSRQGFYIRSYTYAELAPLYELRAALEGMAMRLGLERGEKAGLEGIRHAFDDFDTVPTEDRWAAYRQADQRVPPLDHRVLGQPVPDRPGQDLGHTHPQQPPWPGSASLADAAGAPLDHRVDGAGGSARGAGAGHPPHAQVPGQAAHDAGLRIAWITLSGEGESSKKRIAEKA